MSLLHVGQLATCVRNRNPRNHCVEGFCCRCWRRGELSAARMLDDTCTRRLVGESLSRSTLSARDAQVCLRRLHDCWLPDCATVPLPTRAVEVQPDHNQTRDGGESSRYSRFLGLCGLEFLLRAWKVTFSGSHFDGAVHVMSPSHCGLRVRTSLERRAPPSLPQ